MLIIWIPVGILLLYVALHSFYLAVWDKKLISIIQDAVRLSHSSVVTDLEAIHKLGEGWVGEEALARAVFSSILELVSFRASAMAAIPGTFSVPARRPRSWAPPSIRFVSLIPFFA